MAQPVNPNADPRRERQKYVSAFNATMIKIWRERMVLLGAIDTGTLYASTLAVAMRADGTFTDVTLAQSFRTYGLFVDYGTGSNTPRGNPGDLGYPNRRKRKKWFTTKYYASVMNIREFMADNLGQYGALVIANAINPDYMRRAVTIAP